MNEQYMDNVTQIKNNVVDRSIDYQGLLRAHYKELYTSIYDWQGVPLRVGKQIENSIYYSGNAVAWIRDGELFAESVKNARYKNQRVHYLPPAMFIRHRVRLLEELEKTIESIIIQSKVNTIIVGQGETSEVARMADVIYQGQPFVLVNEFFDTNNVVSINNTSMASALADLNRQKETIKNEINNYFGLRTAGSEKESGLTEEESKANNGDTDLATRHGLIERQMFANKLSTILGKEIKVRKVI